jgi:hypothetical protein
MGKRKVAGFTHGPTALLFVEPCEARRMVDAPSDSGRAVCLRCGALFLTSEKNQRRRQEMSGPLADLAA